MQVLLGQSLLWGRGEVEAEVQQEDVYGEGDDREGGGFETC